MTQGKYRRSNLHFRFLYVFHSDEAGIESWTIMSRFTIVGLLAFPLVDGFLVPVLCLEC